MRALFSSLILVLSILATNTCFAGPENAAAGGGREVPGFDIVLLIDSSGSMKKTDPRDYRKESARLFISLLGADDKVGVVSFGDSAKTLIPLTLNTKNNRSALFRAVSKITSKEFSTDITGAIKQGVMELQSSKRKDRVLILMSDGKLALGDPKKDEASLEELLKLLPDLKAAGIKVYSIAFSELSDPKLLGDMAEKTGGFFRYAATDKDIHIMFTNIFEKIKSPDSVAIEGDSFVIDKDIREAVLLITKKEGTATVVVSPSGKKNSYGRSANNIQWYGSDIFDMITLQEPAAGQWKVKLSSREGNRIFVLTNLKLKSSFDRNTVSRGDKIIVDAWLERDGKRVQEQEVLKQVLFSAEAVGPDGKGIKIPLSEKTGPDAGIFAGEITAGVPGEYAIRLLAEGKTFNRTKDILFKAAEPPQSAIVQAQPQSSEKPAPLTQPAEQIDWELTLLLFGLVDFILVAVAAVLFIWGRRYKKLYLSAQKAQTVLSVHAPAEVPETEEAPAEEVQTGPATVEGKAEPVVTPEEEIVPEPQVQPETGDSTESEKSADTEQAVAENKAESERVQKLLGIIDFQKHKIAELMQVKDVIENARTRIGALPSRSRDLNDKLKAAAESHGLADEIGSALSSLEDDAGELLSYVMVLEKEEGRLAEKFIQWEEELKRLLEGEEYVPAAVLVEPAVSSERVVELETKLSELEDQLMSKDRKIKAIEQQYEDIEKEYMILYHAAQKQQKQPNV